MEAGREGAPEVGVVRASARSQGARLAGPGARLCLGGLFSFFNFSFFSVKMIAQVSPAS